MKINQYIYIYIYIYYAKSNINVLLFVTLNEQFFNTEHSPEVLWIESFSHTSLPHNGQPQVLQRYDPSTFLKIDHDINERFLL